MNDTAYDRSVEAAKEVFRKEAREREAEEYLDARKDEMKPAARLWYNWLTEVWPPENTEVYFTGAVVKSALVCNDNPGNELLLKLITMTLDWLADVAGKAEILKTGKERNE